MTATVRRYDPTYGDRRLADQLYRFAHRPIGGRDAAVEAIAKALVYQRDEMRRAVAEVARSFTGGTLAANDLRVNLGEFLDRLDVEFTDLEAGR